MIRAFLIDTATGKTLQRISAPSVDFLDPAPFGAGKAFVLLEPGMGDIENCETELQGGQVVIVPRAVDPAEQLLLAKLELAALVKAKRDAVEWGGCLTPYGRIDTDAGSQRKLTGGATAALVAGDGFAVNWRMADNTEVPLNAAKMMEVGMIAMAHVSACQQRKNELDALIAAAATMAELEAIDIEAGWPG